ncbi:hypothetical protein GC207_01255 [bacterium]|nr:hypothetical protein [bacterium]
MAISATSLLCLTAIGSYAPPDCIYVANRPDGIDGIGTSADPRHAGTATAFDAILAAAPKNSTINLFPGNYLTMGCGRNPNLKAGCQLRAFAGNVTLKLADDAIPLAGRKYLMIVGAGSNLVEGLTLDMNASVLCTVTGRCSGNAIALKGGNSRVSYCVARNIRGDQSNGLESFPFFAGEETYSTNFAGGNVISNNRISDVLPDIINSPNWIQQNKFAYVSCFVSDNLNPKGGISVIENNVLDSPGAICWTLTTFYGYSGIVRGNIASSPTHSGFYMDTGGSTNVVVQNNRLRSNIGMYISVQGRNWHDIVFRDNTLEWQPSGNWSGGGWQYLASLYERSDLKGGGLSSIRIENNSVIYPNVGTGTYLRYGVTCGASSKILSFSVTNMVLRGNSLPTETSNSLSGFVARAWTVEDNRREDGSLVLGDTAK